VVILDPEEEGEEFEDDDQLTVEPRRRRAAHPRGRVVSRGHAALCVRARGLAVTNLPLRDVLKPLGEGLVPGLATGLVAYYRAEEASGTRVDAKAGLNVTESGGTIGQAAGRVGNAAQFVAANLRFLVRAGAAHSLPDDFTISVWVWPDSLVNGSIFGRGIARCYTAASGNGAAGDWIIAVDASGRLVFYHVRSAGPDLTGLRRSSAVSLVPLGAWTHLVWRRLSSVYTMWVNGVSVAMLGGASTDTGWGNVGFEIGREFTGAVFSWDGRIDELGIWSVGKSDGHIAALASGVVPI
jgi:hypothetical protein